MPPDNTLESGISPNKGKSKDKSLEIALLGSPPIYKYISRNQYINTVDFFIMHTVGKCPEPMHYGKYATWNM